MSSVYSFHCSASNSLAQTRFEAASDVISVHFHNKDCKQARKDAEKSLAKGT